MEKTSRGSPEYKIENLKDKTAIHCPVESEYKQVLQLLEKANHRWGSGSKMTEKQYYWQDRQEKMAIGFLSNSWRQGDIGYYKGDGMYNVITAQEFIASNTPDIQREYNVGDYIVVLKKGTNNVGNKPVDKLFRIGSITTSTITETGKWLHEEERDRGNGICPSYVRHATESEIATITGVQDSWKSGDVLPVEWLDKQNIYDGAEGKLYKVSTFSTDNSRYIEYTNSSGWGRISNTGNLWLSPKQNYPIYSGNVKVEGKYKVGDWIIGEGCYLPTMPCTVERVDGNQVHYIYACDKTKNHSAAKYIRHCRPDEIPQPIPELVNDGINLIGWNIGDELYHRSDDSHIWIMELDGKGGIQSRQTKYGQIDRENVKTVNDLISSGEWKIKSSKAVTNQQLNKPTKTNNYVNEEHICSRSRYTGKAVNLQSDHQAVKRGQARTGYSVCDRGQPGQTQRGYQGHGKAISTM